jgi:tRNA-specific 2-thiouridylase
MPRACYACAMLPGSGKKVVVAMSGGVDSSVAAALLKRDGYDVIGAFLRLGSPEGVEDADACKIDPAAPPSKHKQGCCSVNDAADARRVAALLDVPFYVLNFQDDFGRIIDYFVGEYNAGRTPNPCVRCNDWLKFGRLARYADAVGADFVASGHYARTGVDPVSGEPALMRGIDHAKDQSYVLFGMSRQTLAHTLLPIGGMEKPAVRALAESFGLPTHNKPDSQEICFVPDQDYAGLLKRRAPETVKRGQFVDTAGAVVGEHEGFQQFTIGQRKGIGIARGVPLYVLGIEPATGNVLVGDREHLMKRSLRASQINLLSTRAENATRDAIRCTAKIRYNSRPQPATLLRTGDDEIRVEFDEPQTAITPGQAVVCFDNDAVLGGGWIDAAG